MHKHFLDHAKQQWSASGGQAHSSKAVLSGRPVETLELFDPYGGEKPIAELRGESADQRNKREEQDRKRKEKKEALAPQAAKAALIGLLKGLKDSTSDAVTISVPEHAERALPRHPSLDALKAGDIEANVNRKFDKAEVTARTAMDPSRTSALFDKAAELIGAEIFDGDLAAISGSEKRPKGAQTPAELKEAIRAAAAPKIEDLVKKNFDANKNKPAFNTQQKLKSHYENKLAAAIDAMLLKELYADTQFVIADTNWGDATEKYLHVVAPDPSTGAPKLYKKAAFAGTMEPAEAAWVGGEWQAVTPKPVSL
jgi:hypothetical protein